MDKDYGILKNHAQLLKHISKVTDLRKAAIAEKIFINDSNKWTVIKDRNRNTPYIATEEMLLPYLPEIILGHIILYEFNDRIKE